MAQNVTLGGPVRALHMQILGHKEYEDLPDVEKVRLAALGRADKTALRDFWLPAGAQFGTHLKRLEGNALFELERVLHGEHQYSQTEDNWGQECDVCGAPLGDVVHGAQGVLCRCTFDEDTATFEAIKADRRVRVEGFDRGGDLKGPATVTHVDGTTSTIDAVAFDADALAGQIRDELKGGA